MRINLTNFNLLFSNNEIQHWQTFQLKEQQHAFSLSTNSIERMVIEANGSVRDITEAERQLALITHTNTIYPTPSKITKLLTDYEIAIYTLNPLNTTFVSNKWNTTFFDLHTTNTFDLITVWYDRPFEPSLDLVINELIITDTYGEEVLNQVALKIKELSGIKPTLKKRSQD